MSNIDVKYEIWKNKLLDLGRRNRLLNYKDTSVSTIRITYPEYIQLYDYFVENEKNIKFAPTNNQVDKNKTTDNTTDSKNNPNSTNKLKDNTDNLNECQHSNDNKLNTSSIANDAQKNNEDFDNTNISEDPNIINLSKGTVLTNKNEADLLKALKNLRAKAKTVTEEQGVNVLYLSFGFLNWTDIKDKNTPYTSPLILVPVRLTIESITSPYILKLHEDEIVVNPTLQFKLKNDFNVELPSIDDFENIEEFFKKVKELLPVDNWEITTDVSLSLLSFLKINMYEDLNKHKNSILSNKIIRLISGDTSVVDKIPEELINYDFDKNDKPEDTYQIMDADSSQQDAILFAKKGISFVLQGPPGTGKSQTISNLIAECLANGKKVLFVSEKMAALDVVHKRLESAGLDDFCLVLHSYKANKRAVLDQLETVLALSENKIKLSDEATQKLNLLQAKKQQLNDYAEEVYTKIQPLNKSIYDANGIIANLNNYEDLIFSIDNIRDISSDQYNNLIVLLSQLISTIGKMTGDYKLNPWKNTNLHSVTNEFRHDANSKIPILIENIDNLELKLNQWFEKLHINETPSINIARKLLGTLNIIENSQSIPVSWIIKEDITPLYNEINEFKTIQEEFKLLCANLENEYSLIKSYNSSIDVPTTTNIYNQSSFNVEKDKISKLLSTSLPFCLWKGEEYNNAIELYKNAKEKATCIRQLSDEILKKYEPGIFNLDYNSIIKRMKTDYTSMFKMFNKNYKEDKKALQLVSKEIGKKISDEEMLWIVTKLQETDTEKKWFLDKKTELNKYFAPTEITEKTDYLEYEKNFNAYSSLAKCENILKNIEEKLLKYVENDHKLMNNFQQFYGGIKTDWTETRESLDIANKFKSSIKDINVTIDFITGACTDIAFKELCKDCKKDISNVFNTIGTEHAWFVDCFDESENLDGYPLIKLKERLTNCQNGMSYLEEWIDYRQSRENCIQAGLENYISLLENSNISTVNILPIFKKRFFRLWLDSVTPELQAISTFRKKTHEGIISDFIELDKLQFEIAKARIRANLINQLPSFDRLNLGVDEISILKRELKKQKRIMPIRKLFKEIPNLLLKMKPCLMMSPLSVSLFLEAETYKFDIVIFDEASQVCSENAIGAISRGSQVVITGDSKQLPPTNFFQASLGEDDYDSDNDNTEEDTSVYESILDEANMLPERTLRWHYRSKYESLIAFSNAKIYKNTLITFPSNTEKIPNTGVEYVYVPDGYYDRGGKNGNVVEAKKVAELVFQHFKEQPNRSLGVVAFGEVQQQAIEKVIREMRMQNTEYESFFAEGIEDEFFIKNLENVQGDERDTIIFSIGYAKDINGVFRMVFGPLSKSGGERRLNVAITRAKRNVKLVGSIMPNDIITEKISAEGPKLLRSYIDFAINGESVLHNEIQKENNTQEDAPFEIAISDFLKKNGYSIGTNIGCSEYRIDIGVKHPSLEGIYVLGIETDGEAYHSARLARERDRTRKSVLESMGWKMYRVWSTDWIKDPISEGEKLLTEIKNAIENYGIKKDDTSKTAKSKEEIKEPEEFINLEKKDTPNESIENPYNFAPFIPTDLSGLPLDEDGYPFITDCIMSYVQNEFPLHYDLLCQYIAPAIGNEKVTVRVKREVDEGINSLNKIIEKKGDFIYPKKYEKITLKTNYLRKIQHISQEELQEGIKVIAKASIGITQEGLTSETSKAFGFSRVTQSISEAINLSINDLISNGIIIEEEGKLKLQE